MKNALTEAVFKQTRQQIISKTGLYQSRTLAAIQQQGADMVVVYNGTFAGENNVLITVAYEKIGRQELVSGLHFNSPKLNSQ